MPRRANFMPGMQRVVTSPKTSRYIKSGSRSYGQVDFGTSGVLGSEGMLVGYSGRNIHQFGITTTLLTQRLMYSIRNDMMLGHQIHVFVYSLIRALDFTIILHTFDRFPFSVGR